MLRFRYRRWLTYPAGRPRPWFVRLFQHVLPVLPKSLRAGLIPPAATKPTSDLRPIITVTIRGPTDSLRFEALLDTGSIPTVFRQELAETIGVMLRGKEDAGIRWRGKRYGVEYQTVTLQLTQGGVTWTWDTLVGFSSAEIGIALLGQKGCLEFLDAKFFGARQVVELETNSSFPGTISAATPTA
jgi:hypothetical protein